MSFRLSYPNNSREELKQRLSLDSPRPLQSPQRQSRLSNLISPADLVDETNKLSKREKTKAIFKNIFGGKHPETKKTETKKTPEQPPLQQQSPYVDQLHELDHKESLSKRKAPNLNITTTIPLMPRPAVPLHVVNPHPLPTPPTPSPSHSHISDETNSLNSNPISPTTPTTSVFDSNLSESDAGAPSQQHSSEPALSTSSPWSVTPPKSPRSQSATRRLPYTMQHLSASREALQLQQQQEEEQDLDLPAKTESGVGRTSLERKKSMSSPSLNDRYRAQDFMSQRPAAVTHTMDGIRIPVFLDDDTDTRRRSGPATILQYSRPASPSRASRTSSPARRPASYATPKTEKKFQLDGTQQRLSLFELKSSLGNWDNEADVEEETEHLTETKRRAMEWEERRRRSTDLDKDWNQWTPVPSQLSSKKDVKWKF